MIYDLKIMQKKILYNENKIMEYQNVIDFLDNTTN